MAKPENFLVACDIGTTKICVLIGEQNSNGSLDVIGKGASANRGTRKGNIVNVDATIEAIKRAAEEAEIMAGVQIARAWVGVSGSNVRSFNSRGVVAVAGKDREITKEDVARVIDAARGVQIPQDHEVIHVVPREFAVDGQDGVADPLGMVGARLEADVHVVTAPTAVTSNIVTCANKAGIEVVQLVLEQFAAAEAVLTTDEKELGIGLIDIGGGTTEVAIYHRGSIAHTAVIPIGGDHFTNDLAVVLRAPITDAERLKKKFGCALTSVVGEDDMVEVPMVGGRAPKLCPRTTLSEILQPRAEELLGLVREDLVRLGLEKEIRSGIVLTGGGAELEGIVEVAESIFEGPVRRGIPSGESERCAGQASDLAEQSERPYDLIAADYGRGIVQMMRGNLEEAENILDEALRLSRDSEVRLFLPLVMCALGNLYLQRGELGQARDILLQAKDEAEAVGHVTSTVVVSTYLGSVYNQLGEVQRGLSLVRACQAGAKQKGYGGIEALAVFSEANILSSQGAPAQEDAIACLNRAIDIAARLEARPLLGAARGMLARLLAASGRTAEARAELTQAIALFDQSKMTVQLERAKATLSKFTEL